MQTHHLADFDGLLEISRRRRRRSPWFFPQCRCEQIAAHKIHPRHDLPAENGAERVRVLRQNVFGHLGVAKQKRVS